MTRGQAAKLLGQLLAVDVIGALLDDAGDAPLREWVQKALSRTREIASDEDETAKLAPPTVKP